MTDFNLSTSISLSTQITLTESEPQPENENALVLLLEECFPSKGYAIIAAMVSLDENNYPDVSIQAVTETGYSHNDKIKTIIDEVCCTYEDCLLEAAELISGRVPLKGRAGAIAPMIAAIAWLISEGETGDLYKACDYFAKGTFADGNSTWGEFILSEVRDIRFFNDKEAKKYTLRKNFRRTSQLFVAAFESYLWEQPLPIKFMDYVSYKPQGLVNEELKRLFNSDNSQAL